jgi:hypothetical protein
MKDEDDFEGMVEDEDEPVLSLLNLIVAGIMIADIVAHPKGVKAVLGRLSGAAKT